MYATGGRSNGASASRLNRVGRSRWLDALEERSATLPIELEPPPTLGGRAPAAIADEGVANCWARATLAAFGSSRETRDASRPSELGEGPRRAAPAALTSGRAATRGSTFGLAAVRSFTVGLAAVRPFPFTLGFAGL